MLEQFPDIGLPDWGLSAEPEVSVSKIQLGDGYEIRRQEGINHTRDSWSLGWSNLDPSVAESAYAWLKARKDWKAFSWVNPLDSSTKKVTCTSLRLSHAEYGNSSLGVTFRQDFNPV